MSYHYETFEPLPYQKSFCKDRFWGVAAVAGGLGSGMTICGAWKVADFILNTPAPGPDSKFIICSPNYALSNILWDKYLGEFIPPKRIEKIVWRSRRESNPATVVMHKYIHRDKDTISINGWRIEFETHQTIKRNAVIACGFWADSQCPDDVLTNLIDSCSASNLPGSKLYTFTQRQSVLDNYRDNHPEWRFYNFPTIDNTYLPLDLRQQIASLKL